MGSLSADQGGCSTAPEASCPSMEDFMLLKDMEILERVRGDFTRWFGRQRHRKSAEATITQFVLSG